jgi:lipid-binding SYLF domain-containing protein
MGPSLARALLGAALLSLGPAMPAGALSEPEALVEEARITVQKILHDPEMSELPGFIARARAVLIMPRMIKAGLVLGGEGGTGVLLVKGSDGSWSPPAFYTMAAGSIGLQLGGQVSEAIFTVMNDSAVIALMTHKVKFGGDVSLAVGPVGKGLEASTTTHFSEDVYAFAKPIGLFGGPSLEGAALFKRDQLNKQYYAAGATPRQIVLERKYFNVQADPLRQALTQ